VNDAHRERVELPADAAELARLAERLEAGTDPDPPTPRVDGDGILRFHGRCVFLSPTEERLARSLVATPGSLVSGTRLASDTWKGAAPTTASLRTLVTRLRHRIEPLGLTVRSVRGRGYLVDATDGRDR